MVRGQNVLKIDAALDGMKTTLMPQAKACPLRRLNSLMLPSLKSGGRHRAQAHSPITGEEVAIAIKIGGGRVYVGIECDEDSGC